MKQLPSHQPPGRVQKSYSKLQQAMGNLLPLRRGSASSSFSGEVPLCLPAAWLAASTLRRCYTPTEQCPAPPDPWKSPTAQKHQNKLCPAMQNLLPSQCRSPSPACPQEVLLCFIETLLALPTLRKSHADSKKTGQHRQPSGNIPQQCQGKPCLAMGSTTPPRKRKQQTR